MSKHIGPCAQQVTRRTMSFSGSMKKLRSMDRCAVLSKHLWIRPAAAFDSWDCWMERGTVRSRWDLRHCAKRDFALYIRGHLKLDVGRSSLLLSGRRIRHQCRNSKAQKLRSPNFPMALIDQELPTSLMELKIVLNLSFMKITLILSVIKNFSRTSSYPILS